MTRRNKFNYFTILINLVFFTIELGIIQSAVIVKEDISIPCKSGWYFYEEKCYRFERDDSGILELTWDEAVKKCSEYGGKLVTIYSEDIQNFIMQNFVWETDKRIWIGLHETADKNTYEWQDEIPFKYTNWAQNQPSKTLLGKRQQCGELMNEKYTFGKWNDADCGLKNPFICQTDMDISEESEDPRYCPIILGGGRQYKDSCFNLIVSKRSWESAEKYCAKYYLGHLAEIPDLRTKMFLDQLFGDEDMLSYWVRLQFQQKYYQQWESGNYVDVNLEKEMHKFWNKNSDKSKSCALISKKQGWSASACEKKYPFLCERSLSDSEVSLTTNIIEETCFENSDEWLDFGGENCYYISTKKYSWHEANFDCMRRGGLMASFPNYEEFLKLKPFYSYSEPKVLIGLIGDEYENDFIWADGSELNFEAWAEGEPSSLEEKCTEIFTSVMKWNDIACSAERNYICSAKKTSKAM